MSEKALRTLPAPSVDDKKNLNAFYEIADFQDKGYVILPDVLIRETVDAFREQLEELTVNNGEGWTILHKPPHNFYCTYAPRGRQVLEKYRKELNQEEKSGGTVSIFARSNY